LARRVASTQEALAVWFAKARSGENSAVRALKINGSIRADIVFVRDNGGPDLSAERLAAISAGDVIIAEAAYQSQLAHVRSLIDAYRGLKRRQRMARFEAWFAVVSYLRCVYGEKDKTRLRKDLNLSYKQAQARLQQLACSVRNELWGRAADDPAIRMQLWLFIEETRERSRAHPYPSSSTGKTAYHSGKYYPEVEPLPWPEGFDEVVSAQERCPELADFDPQPRRSDGEWHLHAQMVAAVWPGGKTDARRVTQAKIILAKCRSNRGVREEVGELIRNQLAGVILQLEQRVMAVA
jgi:hypothetical protein